MAYTTINKSSEHFNSKLYTGTGATQSITGVAFQPDFTWIKSRSDALSHALFDAVRGTTKVLSSNSNGAEYTNTDTLTAFGTDGFTVGSNTGVNANGQTRVAWNWLGSNTTASNTDGDITSTVSANTTSGFSIVKWTGNGTQSDQEIGTGLSTELKFVISKPLTTGGATNSWLVYVNGVTDAQDNCLLLESTSALVTGASGGTPNKGTTAGNLLIKAGTATNNNLNNSGTDYIAYCFAEKQGFSKFGSYTGNGSTDGSFIYTGFKPAWVIIKRTDTAHNWRLHDAVRNPSNAIGKGLEADTPDVEYDNVNLDFYSNGMKMRTTTGAHNASGGSYIYMAFAEAPLVGSNNIPCTAR